MSMGVDIRAAEFVVEVKDAGRQLRLAWPTEKYYDLVRSPIQILQMEVSELTGLARLGAPGFPDGRRLRFQMNWFAEALSGGRADWPALPVLVRKGNELEFIDGRHRCEALQALGAVRVPVIVG